MFRRHSNGPRLSPHAAQALAHIEAARAGLEQLWWLWRQHYLEAKRLEQDALTHPDEVPDTGGERPQHEVLLDAIPAGDLGPFERYHATAREAQLQQAAHPIDHDAVEAATIDWLIAEAEGRHSLEDPPLGVVPTARGPIEVEIPRDLPGSRRAPRNTGVRAITRSRWAAIAAVPLVPLATTLYALSLFGIGPLAG